MSFEENLSHEIGLKDVIPGRLNRVRAHFKLSVLKFGNVFSRLKESAQSGVPDEDTQEMREEMRSLETWRTLGVWAVEKEMVAPQFRNQASDLLVTLLMPNQNIET